MRRQAQQPQAQRPFYLKNRLKIISGGYLISKPLVENTELMKIDFRDMLAVGLRIGYLYRKIIFNMKIKDAVYVYRLAGGSKLAWHGRYHAHSAGDYEIHLFFEGDGLFLVNQTRHKIEGNKLFLIKPCEFHSIVPSVVRKPISYYAFLFEPESPQDEEILSLLEEKEKRFSEIGVRERFLAEEFNRLFGEKNHNRSAEYLLLSILWKCFGDESNKKREKHNEKNDHIDRAINIMGKLVQEKLSIDVLAGKLGLSQEHFIRLFHKKLGISPFQYFIRLKVEAAGFLLCDTNLKIMAIAEHFGFKNPFHFSRIFKKCTGLSPLEYRRTFRSVSPH